MFLFSNMALYRIFVNFYMHIFIIKNYSQMQNSGDGAILAVPNVNMRWVFVHKREGISKQKYTKSEFGQYLSNYFDSFPQVHEDERRFITCSVCIVVGKLNLLTYVMIILALFQWVTCSIALFSPADYLKEERILFMNTCKWSSVLRLESDRQFSVVCNSSSELGVSKCPLHFYLYIFYTFIEAKYINSCI